MRYYQEEFSWNDWQIGGGQQTVFAREYEAPCGYQYKRIPHYLKSFFFKDPVW